MAGFYSVDHKNKHFANPDSQVQYLALSSEPKEVMAASRGSFGYHSRYLAKRRILRTLHRLRRGQLS